MLKLNRPKKPKLQPPKHRPLKSSQQLRRLKLRLKLSKFKKLQLKSQLRKLLSSQSPES